MENIENNECFIRCPQCYLIPLIKFNYENENHLIDYKCRNGHYEKSIPINKFIENYSEKKLKKTCNFCLIEYKEFKMLFYCFKCKNKLCYNCLNEHNIKCNNEKKNIINMKRIDEYCLKHGSYLKYYSLNSKKSICKYCDEYKNHLEKIIQFNDMSLNDYKIDNLKKNLINAQSELNLLKNQFRDFIYEFKNKFHQFYEINQNALKLSCIFLKIYEDFKNGEIIENINQIKKIRLLCKDNNNEKTLNEKMDFFSNIIESKNKKNFYIDYEKEKKLKIKLKNQIETTISNVKIIRNILELNDEKLAIIYDNEIIIYNKNTFNKVFTINTNSHFLIQLKNSLLVSTDYHGKLNIYNILNKNIKLIQTTKNFGIVNNLLSLINGQFIVLLNDGKMLFFSKNNKGYQIENIYFDNQIIKNVIQLNDNTLIITKIYYSPNTDNDFYYNTHFFDNDIDYEDNETNESYCMIQSFDLIHKRIINTYSFDKNYKRDTYNLIPFSNHIFIFLDLKRIYLFDILLNCLQIINTNSYMKLFCKLNNGNLFYETNSLDIIIYSIKNNQIKEILKEKKVNILDYSYKKIIQLKNGKYLLEDYQKNIRIFNLKI